MEDLRRIGAEDAQQARALAQLGERLAHDRVEGVSGEHRVEAVAPGRLGDGATGRLTRLKNKETRRKIRLVPRSPRPLVASLTQNLIQLHRHHHISLEFDLS